MCGFPVEVIAGMAMVWFGWVIFAAAFLGLGSLLLRILTPRGARWDCSQAFWCGFVTLILVLQVTNLFSGIGPRTTACIIALGFCAYFLHRSRLTFLDFRTVSHWQLLLLLLALVWLSNRALQAPLLDDSGIYHFSSIRWANELPLPPGVGNLHGHLAFNQSYFLFVAFLNNFPIVGFGHNLANSLLFSAGMLTIFQQSATWSATPPLSVASLHRSRFCFGILRRLLMPITLFFLATCNRSNPPFISSPSADAAIFIVEVVLTAFLLELLASQNNSGSDHSTKLTAIICLAFALITLKLSGLGFVAATLVSVLAFVLRNRSGFSSVKVIKLLVFAAMLIVTWIVRSVIASGYLVYPLAATGLPVDWKVPEHLVRDELNAIVGWARLPVAQSWKIIGTWDWVRGWLLRMADRPDIVAPLGLIFICGICWSFFGVRSLRQTDSSVRSLNSLLGVGLISLAFWFWSAPDPRFLGASLWIIVLWAVGTTIDLSWPDNRTKISRMIVLLFWVSVILTFVRNGLALTTSTGGKWAQSIPPPVLTARTTRSGLVVHTPLPGGYCWDGKLPCTPFFRPQLKLRGNSLAEGFYLDESIDQAPDF
ncbi:MAG: hypothetical protein JO066_00280 [Verrucomicrobia bacterium]|nr:hypothetical protein [Verrucomicrobiota bacterium]